MCHLTFSILSAFSGGFIKSTLYLNVPLTCLSSGLISASTQVQGCQATYQKETDLINLDVIKAQGKKNQNQVSGTESCAGRFA